MAVYCRSPAFSSAVAYALRQQDIVLKEKQCEAIKSIYEGKDVFAWLPTGYGKSLRYQLLLFLFDFKLGRTRAIAMGRRRGREPIKHKMQPSALFARDHTPSAIFSIMHIKA